MYYNFTKSTLILVISIALYSSAKSQEYWVGHFDTEDGLPSNTIYRITQDKLGFIWLATSEGLVRFDGITFRKFYDKRLRSNEITKLKNSLDGGISFLNSIGQAGYIPIGSDSIIMISNDSIKPLSCLRDVFVESKDIFWSTPFNTDHRFDRVQKWVNGNISQKYISYGADINTLFWSERHDAIFALHPRAQENLDYDLLMFSRNSSSNYVSDSINLFSTESRSTWYDGIYTVDQRLFTLIGPQSVWIETDGKFEKREINIPNEPKEFFSITNPSSNEIWLATSNGAFFLSSEKSSSFKIKKHIFKGLQINCVYSDTEGGMWFATTQHGLYYLPKDRYHLHLFTPSSQVLNPQNIINIGPDTLAGIHNNGKLLIIGPKSISYRPFLPKGNYNGIISGRDNEFLVMNSGKQNGYLVRRTSTRNQSNYVYQEIGARNIKCGVWDGKNYWLGSSHRISKLNTKNEISIISHSISGISMFTDRFNREIWLGTNHGLMKIDSNENIIPYIDNSNEPLPFVIQSIQQADDSTLFFGTNGNGLWILEKGRLRKLLSTRIEAKSYYCLLSIKDLLWAVTEFGLLKIDIKTNQIRQIEPLGKIPIKNPYSLNLQEGKIYLTTSTGIYSFSSDQPHYLDIPPRVNLLHFEGSNEEGTVCYERILPAGYEEVKVSFAGMSYAEKLQYEYQLNPDLPWRPLSEPALNLSALTYGVYQLKVRAIRPNGVTSDPPLHIHFEILPYFWQTIWFKTLCVCTLLIITGFSVRQHYKIKMRRAQIQAEMEKRILRTQLSALRAQMNPHFIFNSLTSIQKYLLVEERKNAIQYLADFAKLIRVTFENAVYEGIPLAQEIAFLELYIELERKRFRRDIQVEFYVDEELDTEIDSIPPMLVQPIIENAFQHGLVHKKKNASLSIYMEPHSPDILEVRICDNGKGFEAGIHQPDLEVDSPSGMKVVSTRLDLLGRRFELPLSLQVQGNVNRSGESIGTEVILHIPLNLQGRHPSLQHDAKVPAYA